MARQIASRVRARGDDPVYAFIWFHLTNVGHEWAERVKDSLPHIE